VPGRGQPKLKVTWKITPLTDENDPDGSQRQRQLQVIVQLLRKASENVNAEQGAKRADTATPRADPISAPVLHCSPMATDVPQRELRNNTADLLRRVEAGEQLRITVHGHPVAELVPVDRAQQFVPFDELVKELRGTMLPEDRLEQELRELDQPPRDPFA
jgi:prevent-host-death family protein